MGKLKRVLKSVSTLVDRYDIYIYRKKEDKLKCAKKKGSAICHSKLRFEERWRQM